VVDLAAVKMDFRYDDWFQKEPNVGYETLLYDVMIGDQTLFMRADMVEQGWRIVQPVLDAWASVARRRISRIRIRQRRVRKRPTSCWRATATGPGGRWRPPPKRKP
jgi:glucose-6-phosphate 1-dehydrogenase